MRVRIVCVAIATMLFLCGPSLAMVIPNARDNTVTVDGYTLAVGAYPVGVASSHAYPFLAYVTNMKGNSVSVIATSSPPSIVATIPLGSGGFPVGAAVSPDGTRLYVAENLTKTVAVINTSTHTVLTHINVGPLPTGIAASPDGKKVYVVNSNYDWTGYYSPINPLESPFDIGGAVLGNGSVSVIDTATNTVTATLAVGTNPIGVAVSADSTRIYVSNSGSNTVSRFNNLNQSLGVIGTGSRPMGLAVNAANTKLYIANNGSNNLTVVTNPGSNSNLSAATLGNNMAQPIGVSLQIDSNGYFTILDVVNRVAQPSAQFDNSTVTQFDTSSPYLYVIGTVTVGHGAAALGIFTYPPFAAKREDPTSHLGVFRDGSWFLDHNGNDQLDACGVSWDSDRCFTFGMQGDTPVVGSWTGAERGIGIYRAGSFWLDSNGNGVFDGCGVDACLTFKPSGGQANGHHSLADVPVIGHWNRGPDTLGVFRGGFWFLDTKGNGHWYGCDDDSCFVFGKPGDIPVVGDWNGTGRSELGVFRDGTWILDINGNRQFDGCDVDACFQFGEAGDIPVVGDWDGSGWDKVGVVRKGDWILDRNGNWEWQGCDVDLCATFGRPTDRPVIGQW